MNRRGLEAAVRARHPSGRLTPAEAVRDVLDVIAQAVAAGDKVSVTGFGTLRRVQRRPRTGRNLSTGETVLVPARLDVRFDPGPQLRHLIAHGPGSLDRPVTARRPASK